MTSVFVSHPRDKLPLYFGPKAVAALAQVASPHYNPECRDLSVPELAAAAAHCEIIIAYRQTPGPRELFDALPKLAAFMRCAVDIRTIDVAAASTHGILVTQASAGFAAAVAEWVVGAMLNLGRGLVGYAEGYRRSAPPAPALGIELRGAVVGVIGYGQIGQCFCDLALAFGLRVVVHDPGAVATRPPIVRASLDSLLGQADFVVCLAPASAQTENLMDARAFATMKEGAFFINAGRGELVDEQALLHALACGRLAGCALDVGRAPDQMPSPALARHPRVLATPHIAGLTPSATDHQALETVAQVASVLQGQMPQGAVNAGHASRIGRWAPGGSPLPADDSR